MGLSTDLFEKVWEDREFFISRGRREGDGLRVLLLVPSRDSPLSANTALLRQACALRDELDSSWAARRSSPLSRGLDRQWADRPAPHPTKAEIARIEGRELDAQRLYEQAIRMARENGFTQSEGMANELAAQFYLARGYETSAHAYLRSARSCYLR